MTLTKKFIRECADKAFKFNWNNKGCRLTARTKGYTIEIHIIPDKMDLMNNTHISFTDSRSNILQ